MSNIVVTYEIRVFFEGAQKEVFSTMMSNESIILKDAKKFPKFGFLNSNLINGSIRQPSNIR
jgi:hypothetical protein